MSSSSSSTSSSSNAFSPEASTPEALLPGSVPGPSINEAPTDLPQSTVQPSIPPKAAPKPLPASFWLTQRRGWTTLSEPLEVSLWQNRADPSHCNGIHRAVFGPCRNCGSCRDCDPKDSCDPKTVGCNAGVKGREKDDGEVMEDLLAEIDEERAVWAKEWETEG